MPETCSNGHGEKSDRPPRALPWALLCLWTILLYAGLPLAPRLWEALRAIFPETSFLLAWVLLGILLLLLLAGLVRRRPAPTGRACLLLAGWTAAFALCIAALSRYPVEPLHAAEYVVLALLARWAFQAAFQGKTAWTGPFVFSSFVGVTEEALQWWIPTRVFDVRDIVLNLCAVFFGLLLAALLEYGQRAATTR